MYGLLVENLSEYIKHAYGEDKWEEIRQLSKIDMPSFSTHQVYSETLIPKLAKRSAQVLGIEESEFMFEMGRYFVAFVGQYGYDRMLSVLGRHVRDFMNGLDNLHEYLKFSYPRMRPPSFFCESESSTGMTLHYRSKRKGYAHYTMGQIKEVAHHFYNTDIKIELLREEMEFDTSHVIFQVEFDNKAYSTQENLILFRDEMALPLRGNIIFEIFPFCILFGSNMVVKYIGNSLMQILPNLINKKLLDWFDLIRPLIDFKFQNILKRTNNIFEMATSDQAQMNHGDDVRRKSLVAMNMDDPEDEGTQKLTLKGQMIFMEEWKMILFICTPVMPDLDSMIYAGLYINDLSMHDFSRDLMLAGTQQSVELKLALDQEQLKSRKLEESMKLLDEEMKRTDELLYQMIPKQVADRLRKGENPVDTCETFESVTILFSDVVTFTEICSRITPMQVVSLLNAMYSIFDNLTEKHNVYKVETIGDAYMVVAGAPERREKHGEMVCNMGLDMIEAITDLADPSTGNPIRIRVGVHTGMVVAGVVGMKMPRYCLFGDAVNTASRMESTSEALKVHISETTAETLSSDYSYEERGEITVKGKGTMKTFWLIDCRGRVSCKGEFKIPDIRSAVARNHERRASQISRTYSPVTYNDVAQRSHSSTPIPAATGQSGPIIRGPELSSSNPFDRAPHHYQFHQKSTNMDAPGTQRARAKTFSNIGYDTKPFGKDSSPRPSLTPQVSPPQLEKKDSGEKPPQAPTSNPGGLNLSTTPLPPQPPPPLTYQNATAHPPRRDSQLGQPFDGQPHQYTYPPLQHVLATIPPPQYNVPPQFVYGNSTHNNHLSHPSVMYPPEMMMHKPPGSFLGSMAEKLVFNERGPTPPTAGSRGGSHYRHRIHHSHTCVIL